MSQALAEATKETFHELVSEGTVLVDVWGPACQPCIALLPHVEKLAERDDLKVVKLEAPKMRRLCMELKLMTLPTFVLYDSGQEVARLSDPALSADKLLSWVDDNLRRLGKDVN